MPKFGTRSKANLEGIHPLLVEIAHKVVRIFDIAIVQGVRTTQEQQDLYAKGRTEPGDIVTHLDGLKKKSNHQMKSDGLGYAIDADPYPIDYDDKALVRARYYMMAGYFFAIADQVLKGTEFELRWGGDWDSDKDFTDQSFHDLPHFELVRTCG